MPRLEELTGQGSPATARAVSNLAALYWSWGKLEKAESLALRAEAGSASWRRPARRTGRPTVRPWRRFIWRSTVMRTPRLLRNAWSRARLS